MQSKAEPDSTDSTKAGQPVRWLIIGTGEIAGDFTRGLQDAAHGCVAYVVGSQPSRSQDFVARWGLDSSAGLDTIEEALAREDVDAVYIATPHPSHETIAVAAIRAGKAVLVEKPIALDLASAQRIIDAAHEHQVFLMEAYMYRCHPLITKLIDLLDQGAIGTIQQVEANYCFDAPFDPDHRLFNPALGGGSILDVGGYPVSLAGLVAGRAEGVTYARPTSITASGTLGQTGVEEDAHAKLTYTSGITATLRCAVSCDAGVAATIVGDKGRIVLPNVWLPQGDRHGRISELILEREGKETEVIEVESKAVVYALEAEVVAKALGNKIEPEHPALSHSDTLANMKLIEAWRSLVANGGGTSMLNWH